MQKMTHDLEEADKRQRAARPALNHNDRDPEAKQLHDPWKKLEEKDRLCFAKG